MHSYSVCSGRCEHGGVDEGPRAHGGSAKADPGHDGRCGGGVSSEQTKNPRGVHDKRVGRWRLLLLLPTPRHRRGDGAKRKADVVVAVFHATAAGRAWRGKADRREPRDSSIGRGYVRLVTFRLGYLGVLDCTVVFRAAFTEPPKRFASCRTKTRVGPFFPARCFRTGVGVSLSPFRAREIYPAGFGPNMPLCFRQAIGDFDVDSLSRLAACST